MLSFDGGEIGAVGQRILRLGSPGDNKHTALCISNSYGSIREDYKIPEMITSMAQLRSKRTGESLEKSIRKVVLVTTPFSIDDNGDQQVLTYDEYLRRQVLAYPTKKQSF